MKLSTVLMALLTVGILAGCVTTPAPEEAAAPEIKPEHVFNIKDNVLRRGEGAFTIRAMYDSELGGKQTDLYTLASSLNNIAQVGAYTICFDLVGYRNDGKELAPQVLTDLQAVYDRTSISAFTGMIRVMGDYKDPEFRKNAAATAARELAHEGRFLYYFEGPDAAELAAIFESISPHLVTIAPANADITVVSEVPPVPEPPAEGEDPAPTPPPVIVVDAIPGRDRAEVHFLLDNDEETRWALDESLKDPAENAPWEPNWEMISEEERAEGFVPLFNGKDLDGWWARSGNPDGYHVSEDGFIEWIAKGTGGMVSRERYDNFTLRLEWKILPGGNSGVWLRAQRAARSSKVGMEYQMRGDRATENPDKSNTAAVYDVLAPMAMPAYKEGLWNEMEVTFNGPLYKAYLNGVLVQDVNFEDHDELIHRLRKGFIVLTDHSDYVAYRNIRVKKL